MARPQPAPLQRQQQPPSPASASVGAELRAVAANAANFAKIVSEKRVILGPIAPNVEDNELVDSDFTAAAVAAPRARSVSSLVRPKHDAPMTRVAQNDDGEACDVEETPTGHIQVDVPKLTVGRSRGAAQTLSEIDAAVLAKRFAGEQPVMKNAGSPFVQFCMQWNDASREVARVAAAGGDTSRLATDASIVPGAAASSSQQQAARNKRNPTPGTAVGGSGRGAKSVATSGARVVPSDVSSRYPTDSMPLFATIPPPPAHHQAPLGTHKSGLDANGSGSAAHSKRPRTARESSSTPALPPVTNVLDPSRSTATDPARRAIELNIDKALIPRHLIVLASAVTVSDVESATLASSGAALAELKNPKQVLVRWSMIQERAYVEATSEEQECVWKGACLGMKLKPTNGSPFIFRKWNYTAPIAAAAAAASSSTLAPSSSSSKNTSKGSDMCYACILRALCLRKDYERGTKGVQRFVESPFTYMVGVPGEYSQTAFMPTDSSGDTSVGLIRQLLLTDLIPSMVLEGRTWKRCYVERPDLRYCDGSKLVAALPSVNPTSYVDFDILPYENERILGLYFFKDLPDLYAKLTTATIPDWLRVMHLALMPIELGVKLLADAEFRQKHLPEDFMKSSRYLSDKFDLAAILNLSEHRIPPFEGHLVFWLLHIRMNSALFLISEGLHEIADELTGGFNSSLPRKRSRVPQAAATDTDAQQDQRQAPAPPAQQPASLARQSREWFRGKDVHSFLVAEMNGKRAQLERFLKSHARLIDHICAQLSDAGAGGRIDDDSLLHPDVFAVIKPEPSYIGPLFPEDRCRIEYVIRPHVVHKPNAVQRASMLLSEWCSIVQDSAAERGCIGSSTALDRAPAVLCDKSGAQMHWRLTTMPPPRERPAQPASLGRLMQGDKGARTTSIVHLYLGDSLAVPLHYIISDFRATHWWLSRDVSDDFVTSQFARLVPLLFQTWNYARYHPRAAKALASGAWRTRDRATSYTLLATLLLRVHVITGLIHTLQALYNSRADHLDQKYFAAHEERTFQAFAEMVQLTPEQLFLYVPPPDRPYLEKVPPEVATAQHSQDMLQECIYQLHKILCSHLPLAHAMVVNCTDSLGEGPTDAMLYDTLRSNTNTVLDSKTRPSLYELYYPRDEAVMCEDNLVDCASREPLLRFISERSGNEPLLEIQEKALPARCHPRDLEKRICEMVSKNGSTARYYAQTVHCTLVGGYRTARVRPRFAKLLQLHSVFSDPSKPDGLAVDIKQLVTGCRFLSVSAIRENTMLHIRHNPGFLAAVQLRFKEGGKDYTEFDCTWLRNCTDEVRRMIDMGVSLDNISAAVKDSQGRTKPFVYRRTRTDTLKEIWNKLRDIYCNRIVEAYMLNDAFEWPSLLTIERDDLRDLFELVCSCDPHSESFDYGPLLSEALGLDDEAVAAIKEVESTFVQRGSSDGTEKRLENALDEPQLLIAMAFFYILRAHAAVRTVPLDESQRTLQALAVARRTGTLAGEPLPVGAHTVYFCSVLGCHKCKTPMVQEFGMSRIGNSDVSYDLEQGRAVCRPRKTSKGGYSLAARRQRDKRATAGSAGPAEYDPDAPAKAYSYLDAKSIPTARREFIGACQARDSKAQKLLDEQKCTRDTLLENAKVKRCIEAVKRARDEVAKAVRKEANQHTRTMFSLPCEDGVMTSRNLLGYVVERNMGKDKVERYTLCTMCGCASVFSTSMIYCNGFTCSICDARLREDLHRPSCIGCSRLYLTTDIDKRSKSKDHQTAQSATGPSTSVVASLTSGGARVVPVSEQQRRAFPGPKLARQSPELAAAASQATTAHRPAAQRKTSKRARGELDSVGPVVVRESSTAEEDRLLREKRSARGARSIDSKGPEEWFEYRMLDSTTYEFRYVYVCDLCAFERPWLRTLEPICTVQDFTLFIQRRVTRLDEALRRLNVGIYAEEGNQSRLYAPESVIAAMDSTAKAQRATRLAVSSVASADYAYDKAKTAEQGQLHPGGEEDGEEEQGMGEEEQEEGHALHASVSTTPPTADKAKPRKLTAWEKLPARQRLVLKMKSLSKKPANSSKV